MFETVAVEPPNRRVAYEALPLSIALHATIIAGVAVMALWDVGFPRESPHAIRAYVLATTPDPPLPPALKLAPSTPPPKVAQLPATAPRTLETLVAPSVIPDVIPQIDDRRPASIFTPSTPVQGGSDGTPGGSEFGVPGGVLGGVAGGMGIGSDGRVHIERDKALPLIVVRCVYPDYPDAERSRGKEATVVVRYIIATDGSIKDVTILDHAKDAAFDTATLKALREWRFRPLMRDGRAVEVVHELTVIFQLVAR